VHAVLCAAGYNLRWLLRAIARLGLKGFFAFAALLPADILANNLSRALRIRFTLRVKRWLQTTLRCSYRILQG